MLSIDIAFYIYKFFIREKLNNLNLNIARNNHILQFDHYLDIDSLLNSLLNLDK